MVILYRQTTTNRKLPKRSGEVGAPLTQLFQKACAAPLEARSRRPNSLVGRPGARPRKVSELIEEDFMHFPPL
jgi:hypothetical protein